MFPCIILPPITLHVVDSKQCFPVLSLKLGSFLSPDSPAFHRNTKMHGKNATSCDDISMSIEQPVQDAPTPYFKVPLCSDWSQICLSSIYLRISGVDYGGRGPHGCQGYSGDLSHGREEPGLMP